MSKRNENRPGYKKTKVGWIPEEWECNTLKLMCINNGEYGACATAIPYSKEHVRYIRITDITDDGKLSDEKLKSIDCISAENYLLKNGDFLFARTGATVGKTYLHHKNDQAKYAYAGYLIKFVLDPKKILGCYLRLYTSTYKYWNWIQLNTRSGAQPNINATEYGSLLIPTPALFEQQKIAEVLSAWDRAIDQTKKLIEAKQKLKKGLMQQLLAGRMRFPEFGKPVKNKSELPEGWRLLRLKNLCIKQKGKKVVTNDNKKGLPYIGSASFDGIYNEYTTDETGIKCGYEDILLLWDGENAGKVSVGHNGIISSTVAALKIKERKANPYFTSNYILSQNKKLRSVREGSGIPHMPGDFLFWFKMKLPSLNEQNQIASLLRQIDKKIIFLQKKESVLETQRKGLMQKLLTGEIRVKA